MPRPPIPRWVARLPAATYFKPAGVPMHQLEEVSLTLDELEALRLKDIEGLEQEEAAEQMGVARTTFRRVLVEARAKVAAALVEGKAIRIEGGPVRPRWRCPHCGGPVVASTTTNSGRPAAAADPAPARPGEPSDASDVGFRRWGRRTGWRCGRCGWLGDRPSNGR